jgi:hypothetical protein
MGRFGGPETLRDTPPGDEELARMRVKMPTRTPRVVSHGTKPFSRNDQKTPQGS